MTPQRRILGAMTRPQYAAYLASHRPAQPSEPKVAAA